MNPEPLWLLYALPFVTVLTLYVQRQRRREARSRAVLDKAEKAGLTEPPSLHPVIDPNLCMGSGACTRACPEGTLGIIDGKAHLINPTVCIGHGACAAACPVEAITLVLGTERRGIDIPYVKPDFETNVPGLFVAGELGGMGLIRKAAEQGRQAIDTIARGRAPEGMLDVVIVGAGPAGLSATLAAMDKKLRFVAVEQEDSLGGTVYHYPRNKLVMTQPVSLPIIGKVKLTEVSKESLLEFWQGIVERVAMPIQFDRRVERIEPIPGGYAVVTTNGEYRARNVLLAIGRRGTPRKLGVPGEELPKVVYRLVDPEQYAGRHVLVVGGGDSAIEAAVAIAGEQGATVTLSYRGNAFGRVKPANRERVDAAALAGRLAILLESEVRAIDVDRVRIGMHGQDRELPNDAVIVCAGGVLPTPMLQGLGIRIETKRGTA